MYGGRRIEMNKKIALTVFTSICITLFLIQFNVYVEIKSAGGVDNPEDSTEKMPWNTVILNQTFDDERVGDVPKNWTITESQYGGFTVDNQTYYSGGKSAEFVDNSTVGSPCPYINFTEQKGTIVATFAIRLAANSGNNTNLIIYVDDGNFTGSNIKFTERSTTEYHDDNGSYVLGNYLNGTWCRIKMIMNIPNNIYDIYVNDLLEAKDAKFTKFGTSHDICRIIFGGTLFWQPMGYIDDIVIRTSIKVPEDYPTIQEAIDAATLGNTIFVAPSSRPYFENVHLENKHDLKLIGEDRSTTIIDGRFGTDRNVVSIDKESDNVTISGFTIKNGDRGGIFLGGSGNTITNNIITSNRDYGIHVEAENNNITKNIISNNEIGVNSFALKSNIFYRNRFICNTRQALDYGSNAWDNGEEGNYWSDYNETDGDKDGIGDTSYFIPFNNTDRRPLFLMQKVSQKPDNPSYNESVKIDVTLLEDVQVDEAILDFTCDSTWNQTSMTILGNKLSATIRPQPYWTEPLLRRRTVHYRIHVENVCGIWVVSANFSYTITDTLPPRIENVSWTPKQPHENERATVGANASEAGNASGIGEVRLFLNVSFIPGWWSVPMVYDNSSGLWNATIQNLPGKTTVEFYVNASDRAGNWNRSKTLNYTVIPLPPPPELYVDKTILDFELIPEGATGKNVFHIKNMGGSTLEWKITIKEGITWLCVEPENGSTTTKTETINVTVDATSLAYRGQPYRGELLVTSNGDNKSIYVFVTVTKIIIDRSWVSDDHCGVGSNQTIYFHAIWGHNASAVQKVMLNVTCTDYTTNAADWTIYTTNATGWVSFTNSSLIVGKRTWMVTGVDCNGITSFTQTAPNPSITWEAEPREETFWTQWTFLITVVVVAALGGGIFSTLAFWTLREYKKKS